MRRPGQLSPQVNKTRYATPQQPENAPNGRRILTTCRLFRLSFLLFENVSLTVRCPAWSNSSPFHQDYFHAVPHLQRCSHIILPNGIQMLGVWKRGDHFSCSRWNRRVFEGLSGCRAIPKKQQSDDGCEAHVIRGYDENDPNPSIHNQSFMSCCSSRSLQQCCGL